MPPKSSHLARRDVVARVAGQARIEDSLDGRVLLEEGGDPPAFSQCARIRTASVFSPRRTSQQSNGPGMPPSDFCRNSRRSAIVGSFVATKPPTTSECPPRYFVVEWSDDVGAELERPLQVRRGERVVHDELAPTSCAASAAARMSTMFSSGFVGVSSQTSRVRSSRCSAQVRVELVRPDELEP